MNLRFDTAQLSTVVKNITEANVYLRVGGHVWGGAPAFTTSPALGAVATQYSAYLGAHPGSLTVATRAATTNVQWLHDSLVPLIGALTEQEYLSVDTFTGMLSYTDAPDKEVHFGLPPRPEIPVLDLAYMPPVAAVEATTPLKALTAMFAGDDSGIIAASESWASASRRMLQASESLQSAAALIAGTTEGSAFSMVEQAISTIANQCATVAANSTAMSTSMLQLPPIRAAAHAQLIAMEAELAAEATAAGAATGGAGAAAIAAKSQAQVAAFVAGYLQPALDTARPLVTNLTIPVVNHTGTGALHSGGGATMAAEETVTQVAGGATAPGAGQAVAQPNAAAPQTGQVATTPAGASQVAQVGQAPARPASAIQNASGGAQAASPASVTAGRSAGTGVAAGQGAGGRASLTSTTSPGGPRNIAGGVMQPLLPKGISVAVPRSPSTGHTTGGGPQVGSGTTQNGVGARGAAPGTGGATPAVGNGSGTHGHRADSAATAPLGAGGQKGTRTGQGKGASTSSLFGSGQGRRPKSRRTKTGSSLLDTYFRRQFLGEKKTTVKKVIR